MGSSVGVFGFVPAASACTAGSGLGVQLGDFLKRKNKRAAATPCTAPSSSPGQAAVSSSPPAPPPRRTAGPGPNSVFVSGLPAGWSTRDVPDLFPGLAVSPLLQLVL